MIILHFLGMFGAVFVSTEYSQYDSNDVQTSSIHREALEVQSMTTLKSKKRIPSRHAGVGEPQ